jgi:hypothetical protein
MKKGGTVCIFTIGKPGTSAAYLRYIARERAGEGSKFTVLLLRLPEYLLWESDMRWFVREAVRWARAEEQEERRRYRGHGTPRTHYRAILSFEADIGNTKALSLVKSWLDTVLPHARACAFLHSNTAHLHAHVWIAARQIDGRKINLSARAYRCLDEQWNRLYAEALGRDEREHLDKKRQTQQYKQHYRAGEEGERPERAKHFWTPALFNERERQRLGATRDDPQENRTHRHQPPPSRDPLAFEAGERAIAAEKSSVLPSIPEAEQTVSEALRLHQEAQRLAEGERKPVHTIEPDRER